MAHPDAVFAALADPRRRAILAYLKTNGKMAGEIARRFEVSWPSISRHLRILRSAGLIWETRDGRSRFYELNHQALAPVLGWLNQFDPGQTGQPTFPATGPTLVGREYSS